jgi:outer membrane beta-barrel protein
MTNSKHKLGLLIALLVAGLPLAAQAQRKSPLEDAPAIRKRVELRASRLEVGAGLGSTVAQDFYHTVLVNVKLGYHFNDWLSLAGVGAFGVANLQTAFQQRLDESLRVNQTMSTRQPSETEAKASMSKLGMMLGAQLEFTPFTGKYSLGGKIFAHYDFYAFAGAAFLNVKPTDAGLKGCVDAAPMGTTSCSTTGWIPGGNVGLGLHTFFNQWLGLNVELRDVVAKLNPSGRDVNGDGVADKKDLSWLSTFMVAANLVVYLPSTAVISP